MNTSIFYRCCILFCLTCSAVLAGAKADVQIQVIDNTQWPAQYLITLTPPEHHHAYLDKGVENAYIPVTLDRKNKLEKKGLSISQFTLPAGEFDELVKATVLRGKGSFSFSITSLNSTLQTTETVDVALRYQLCDEITNVCFRPKTEELAIQLPKAGTVYVNKLTVEEVVTDDLTWMEQIINVFNDNKNNTALLFFLVFVAGLLSVATPCVYPMLPITAMIVTNRAQGDVKKEKLHAFVYLVGIIGTYVVLGVAAGMTGGAFNSFMQSATVNLAFALFFAFFAISLLGYFEFSFMQAEVGELDQSTAKIGGYFGTWVMGSIAGLVISPCVGPIVFALLLQVADNIAAQTASLAALGEMLGFWGKLGIAIEGGILMGGFGLGVGLPFFVVGIVKLKKLPKAGFWMNKIKYSFGFLILYFAYTYFSKGLSVLNIPQSIILMLTWGLVILWIAIVHLNILSGGSHDQHPTRKLSRFVGVVTFILGAWLFVSGLNHIPHADKGGAATKAVNTKVEDKEGGVAWLHSFSEAKEQARISGKPIFIDFYASWCANCLEFAKEVVTNKSLNTALRESAIALKVIDNTPEFERFKASPEHRQLKIGLPYFAILSRDGKLHWSGTDYKATNTMINVLSRLNKL